VAPDAVLVSASGVQGGAERALLGLARELPGAGLEPLVVLLQPGPFEDWLHEAGVPTVVVPAGRLRQPHRHAGAVRRLVDVVRRAGHPVVLSNMTKSHLYAGVAASLCRTPAVLWQHMVPHRSAMEVGAGALRCDAIVCSTEAAAAAQRSVTPRRTVHVIPPGTDVERVAGFAGTGREVRARHDLAADVLVGIVGRLQPWKGQELFLESAALVAERFPDVRFVVVGGAILGWEGDYEDVLRRRAAELGIADRVLFAGHQDPVHPWYDALDVVVNASRNEPYGLVLVEAMALGTPVVAPADPGPSAIVEEGRSGLLVGAGAAAMAGAVGCLVEDERLRRAIGEGARCRAAELSSARTAARFAELFDGLRGRPPVPV
jgi:glycosyltransferase involved in cell wall biosynthesis